MGEAGRSRTPALILFALHGRSHNRGFPARPTPTPSPAVPCRHPARFLQLTKTGGGGVARRRPRRPRPARPGRPDRKSAEPKRNILPNFTAMKCPTIPAGAGGDNPAVPNHHRLGGARPAGSAQRLRHGGGSARAARRNHKECVGHICTWPRAAGRRAPPRRDVTRTVLARSSPAAPRDPGG